MHHRQLKFSLSVHESTTEKKKEIWAEERYPHLDFILIPILALAGKLHVGHTPRITYFEKKRLLLKAFGYTGNSRGQKTALADIRTYITQESAHIKIQSERLLTRRNMLSADDFEAYIVLGAKLLLRKNAVLENGVTYLRSHLPKSSHALYFSKVARYVLNGLKDRYWYHENATTTKKLLEYFPAELVFDIFAATSIRNNLKGNVTKFFRALDQYYRNERHTILIGKRGEKAKVLSFFKGFLDAQIYHLEAIRAGKPFGNGEKNKARKIRNFSRAMQGYKDAVVADIWLMRVFNADIRYKYKNRLDSRSPTGSLYDAIEWYVQTMAHFGWCEPRELSASLWSGIRSETNTSETRYSEVISRILSHGLFEEIYGSLRPSEKGVYFEEKSN